MRKDKKSRRAKKSSGHWIELKMREGLGKC